MITISIKIPDACVCCRSNSNGFHPLGGKTCCRWEASSFPDLKKLIWVKSRGGLNLERAHLRFLPVFHICAANAAVVYLALLALRLFCLAPRAVVHYLCRNARISGAAALTPACGSASSPCCGSSPRMSQECCCHSQINIPACRRRTELCVEWSGDCGQMKSEPALISMFIFCRV